MRLKNKTALDHGEITSASLKSACPRSVDISNLTMSGEAFFVTIHQLKRAETLFFLYRYCFRTLISFIIC